MARVKELQLRIVVSVLVTDLKLYDESPDL